MPPDDIYSPRLAKLSAPTGAKRRARSAAWRFFWVNGQDYVISDLTVKSADEGSDRKTVTAKFMNIDRREEIHFDFLRNGRRWLLDEVHSTSATAILKNVGGRFTAWRNLSTDCTSRSMAMSTI
jgi:hypothetical protein